MRQTKEPSCFGGIDHRPLSQGLSLLCSECAGPTPWRWALRRTPAPRNARPEDARSSAFCPSEAPSRPERSDAPPALHRAAYLQSTSAILVSGQEAWWGASSPSSALSRMRAWVNWRAGAWPQAIKPSKLPRSSLDKLTGLLLFLGIERPPHILAGARPPPRAQALTIPEKEYCCKPIMSGH